MKFSTETLKKIPIFGIAGNFAEHLSQAGEDADFVNVVTKEKNAPKGVFPIYLPNFNSFLTTFPLSSSMLEADFSSPINCHLEPEVCVMFNITYQKNKIANLQPIAFTAFNDCSIRRPNANKISHKKNWGENCSGIAQFWQPINSLQQNNELDNYSIVSYLKRNNEYIPYGMNSPVTGYQYFHQKLLNWLIDTFNNQKDEGSLEDICDYLTTLQNSLAKQLFHSEQRVTLALERRFFYKQEMNFLFMYMTSKKLTNKRYLNILNLAVKILLLLAFYNKLLTKQRAQNK
jgi:hypothetical protein